MKIIICACSKMLRNGNISPKDYPYWEEVIRDLKDTHQLVQLASPGEKQLCDDCRVGLNMQEIKNLIDWCDTFITIDSFFAHMAHFYNKHGVVIFSRSNPQIFGYKENINLLRSAEYLREDQFGLWESCLYLKQAFVPPSDVIQAVTSKISALSQ